MLFAICSTTYSGDHGFEVSVQKQPKETKSASWTVYLFFDLEFDFENMSWCILLERVHFPDFLFDSIRSPVI